MLVESAIGVKYEAEDPNALAAKAGLDLETYAAARLGTSEGYSGPKSQRDRALASIIHVAMNQARTQGLSLSGLLLKSKNTEADGHFGEQIGRFASTMKNPTWDSIKVAKLVMDGSIPDPTNGAISFIDPTIWSKLAMQSGRMLRPLENILLTGKDPWVKRRRWSGDISGIGTKHLAFFHASNNLEANKRSMRKLLSKIDISRTNIASIAVLVGAGFYLLNRLRGV